MNNDIEKIKTDWLDWLNEKVGHGLNEDQLSNAIKAISNKLNEVIEKLNQPNPQGGGNTL